MQKLFRLFNRDRRRGAVREPARRHAFLFEGSRLIGEARVLDESPGGLRISVAVDRLTTPDAFTVLEVETAVAHEVEVAWRTERELGLRVVSEQRLRGYVPPEYQTLKAAWEKAAVLTA